MKEQPLKFLIADHQPLTRSVIKKTIAEIYPNSVFVETEDGASTLLLLSKEHFHLAIIDENIPILDGINVIENFAKEETYATKFILISTKHNYSNYQKGIELGVNVYIDKSHVKNEIKYGIRALKNGSTFLCDCLTKEMSIINGFANKISNLGPKEILFLNELKEGKSIQEISDHMVISNKSVKQIVLNICDAFDINKDIKTLSAWAKSHKHYIQ